MGIEPTKGETVILKIDNQIIEKQFSHYEKKNGNGSIFYTTDGQKHNINQLA